MKEDKLYNNIQKAFENLPENFNVLEEQIDVDIQMQYFEFSKKLREKKGEENTVFEEDELFSVDTDVERKKEILSVMAVVDDVKSYRTIERFLNGAEGVLKSWAILALQENRMLLQSSLLDEQQVFISSGLGGKGQKLRYFVVFISENRTSILNETQRKLLRDELIFELKDHDGEFELIDFMDGFSTCQVLLPLKADLKFIFRNVVEECNQYGNFLSEDMIVTNVKVLSKGEIIQMLSKNEDDGAGTLEIE